MFVIDLARLELVSHRSIPRWTADAIWVKNHYRRDQLPLWLLAAVIPSPLYLPYDFDTALDWNVGQYLDHNLFLTCDLRTSELRYRALEGSEPAMISDSLLRRFQRVPFGFFAT